MSNPIVPGYDIVNKIGSGSYSNVYKGFKQGKEKVKKPVAIKCILKGNLSGSAVDNIISEIKLLKTLKHEHIVEMIDFLWDEKHIFIIMEYCTAGDLSSYIKKQTCLPELYCKIFLQQLALALKYMQEHNICHLDLKPQNLLLTNNPNLTLKVADFGFAVHTLPDKEMTSVRGSPLYMAPEVILKGRYDAKADLWSVGVVLYECLFGKAPYSSQTVKELLTKIKNQTPIDLPANSKVSPECKDLLKRLLQSDPSKRITYEAFFAHEFLDLKHMPTEENYRKAIKIVEEAIEADKQQDIEQAVFLYSEALSYLIPFLIAEPDSDRKLKIRNNVHEYIQRAELLKNILKKSKPNLSEPSTSLKELSDQKQIKISSIQKALSPSEDFKILRQLCSKNSTLLSALDQGRTGELYIAEGSYNNALETLQGALSQLMPILIKEPAGDRKILLHNQVEQWMKAAEHLKELLAATSLKESNPVKDNCFLQ
ncbi:serine/threonine-protein kinase ULK3-like [Ctenocephalides felis]|uniref:serine/threonine-protein kinase ULK3-like n=1 Tax=Ctenocephalides felis TaxID=7515 RepID=UPI000E6E423B|nr:serine/threonine-protein kinase ULK3-like [Ctenocephalides felis]